MITSIPYGKGDEEEAVNGIAAESRWLVETGARLVAGAYHLGAGALKKVGASRKDSVKGRGFVRIRKSGIVLKKQYNPGGTAGRYFGSSLF